MTESLYFTTHSTVIGDVLLVASARGVRYLTLLAVNEDAAAHLAQKFCEPPVPAMYELQGFFATTLAAIDGYLEKGRALNIPFEFADGTALQRAVWLAIAKIPYGETISYTQLAERVGFPRAVRAVASACGANPVPLIVPCHRVIGKDGGLGGFSLGGTHIKEKLLALENPSIDATVAA